MTAVAVRELHPGDEWHCLDWTLHVSSDAQVEGNSAAFAVAEFPWLMHRPADEVLDVKVAGS